MKKRSISTDLIEKIIALYVDKVFSLRKISKELCLSRNVISRILVNEGIKIRDSDFAIQLTNIKHFKTHFNGNTYEKAYMIGIVKGDLTPIKKSKHTLRLTVSSTHKSFIQYLETMFVKYGPVKVYPTKDKHGYHWNFSADLDFNSFSFLQEAKEPTIADFDSESFMHFLAGFIDTDGSIYIKKAGKYTQFVVRMFGQDRELLMNIHKRLQTIGFHSNLQISAREGDIRNYLSFRMKYNRDYYILELSRRKEVMKFINLLPLKHPEKIARKEVLCKLSKNKVIYNSDLEEMHQLRKEIKNQVKKDIEYAKNEYQKRKRCCICESKIFCRQK